MYWSNILNAPRIERATLDGGSRRVIVSSLGQVSSLTIDPVKGRLFWTDVDRGRIESCDLDGLNRRDVVAGLKQPLGLTTFREHIYWTKEQSHEIHLVNVDQGINYSLVASSSEYPLAITVFSTAINTSSGSY